MSLDEQQKPTEEQPLARDNGAESVSVEFRATNAGAEAAGRWVRLAAALIDGLIMMVVMLPVMYITGAFTSLSEDGSTTLGHSLLMILLGVAVFVVINGKLLKTQGQTIGKRAMDIRIVTLKGTLPNVKENLIPRYAIYFLLGQLPLIGPLLSLVNLLVIFGKDSRCGHDYVAGTKVVKCQS